MFDVNYIRDEMTWDEYSGMTFSEHEQIGRIIYSSITPEPHEFMEWQYARYDASATAGTVTSNAEIKYRHILREKWDKLGYWLEKTKYDALMNAYMETGSIPLFYTFLREGVGYYWDLRKLNPIWKWEKATATTADGQYGKIKVWKEVCHPMPNEGYELKW